MWKCEDKVKKKKTKMNLLYQQLILIEKGKQQVGLSGN